MYWVFPTRNPISSLRVLNRVQVRIKYVLRCLYFSERVCIKNNFVGVINQTYYLLKYGADLNRYMRQT